MNNPVSSTQFTLSVEEWIKESEKGPVPQAEITLSGYSMQPLIQYGRDTVTVSQITRPPEVGDIVLFRRRDGVYVMHRIKKITDDSIITIGDNCIREDSPIRHDQVCGLAVKTVRNGRSINLDSHSQRIYGKLWMLTLPLRRPVYQLKHYAGAVRKRLRKKK